jgi:hypothetical protein
MQLNNMMSYLNGFEQACQMAACEDDGRIDKQERKQLDQIKKACRQFRAELERIAG